jgi:hypothetical protein
MGVRAHEAVAIEIFLSLTFFFFFLFVCFFFFSLFFLFFFLFFCWPSCVLILFTLLFFSLFLSLFLALYLFISYVPSSIHPVFSSPSFPVFLLSLCTGLLSNTADSGTRAKLGIGVLEIY